MDKAEHAVVVADKRFDRLQLDPHALPFTPNELEGAVRGPQLHPFPDFGETELQVDDVDRRGPVQLQDFVAGLETDSSRKRIRLHIQNTQRLR